MRTKLNLIFLAILAIMTSCSSDDNDPVATNLGGEVAGSYSGYTSAAATYFTDMINVDQTIVLVDANNNTVNLTYKSEDWGTFTFSKLPITVSNGEYSIEGEGTTVMGMDVTTQKNYTCTVSATISKDKKTTTYVFKVPTVMGGLVITFTNGDAPANKAVADKYTGYTVANFQYTTIPMTNNAQTVTIAANTDATAKLTYTSNTWGVFTIETATVILKDGSYAIEGTGTTVMGMEGAEKKSYPCTVAGTISKDKKTVALTFTVPSVMGGLTIAFKEGDAPANMVVAASYSGTMDMSVNNASLGVIADSKVTIKTQDDGKVQVTLSKFSLESGMGFKEDVVIDGVDVTLTDGVYTISQKEISTTSGATAVTGDMSGTIQDEKADIKFNLKPGAMPFFIVCTFASK